jgi:hypothetical protein
MFTAQQLTGPVAPGQYGPLQVSGPGSYYPLQTTDWTSMFSAMMPMIMMIMMMGMLMPMMKGVTASAKE